MLKPKIGVYPGTFDPITSGHLDIITRSLLVVDVLVIAIAEHSNKDPIFSLTERLEMARHDVDNWVKNNQASLSPEQEVEVVTFNGLLVDFAKKCGSSVLIRGLRAVSDFEYEFQMSCMNSKLDTEIQTIFLPASEKTHFISSRFVKEVAMLGGDVSGFVSANVLEKLKHKLRER
jgi:pantetheine-phosphate adenylyltransferase